MFTILSPADKRRVLFFPFIKIEPGAYDGADEPRAARDVPPGECWSFTEHRTLADVIAAEGAR
jgi:hypothetical protein